MDRNKPGYMNFADIADRLESSKLNAYDVVYTKDTHEVVFIREDKSLMRMKCRLDVYPSVVVAEYYLNLNTDTYVGQIVGIEQGEWICLYNVNYADNKFIVRKVGVDEYGQLTNKPQINGVTLEGNKTTEQLGINIPTRFSQLYDDIGYVTFDHLIENYYSKSQIYSKSEVDTVLAGKADTGDIPTDLADLNDDSGHRTVSDEDIAKWDRKSNVVANPVKTTKALNSIEIDGVGYAIAGSGGGAVNSVNGKTGHVILNASDVGALPDDTDIPSQLSDLDEDSTHRVVTDAEKVAWNNKSDFSGSYRDLTDQPTIPSALSQLNDDTTHRVVTDTEKNTWNNKSDFSGSYNDLTDQPTIPTVNNPTITIQKNGQSVDSFTLNQSGNKSINVVVPTKTSDLSNDSNFINSTVNNLANYYLKSQTYTQAEVDALIDAAINGRFRKVNALPVTGEPNIIYLVPKADPETSDACDEYIWQDNAWELIGNTNIDLSGYVTDEELTIALADYLTISAFSTTIANYYNKTEIGALLDDKVDKVDGKGLSTNDYSNDEKTKLAGIASGAEVNQNAFSNVKVGSTTIASGGKTATLELEAGNNITLTPDVANKKVVLSATDTTYSEATTSAAGLMSASDKTKLNGISTGATKTASSTTNGHIEIDDVDTTVYDDTAVTTAIEIIEDELSTDSATIEGNPLNFSTLSAQNAESTIIDLEPIQDLHGFTKPWVGGAGKNKFDIGNIDLTDCNVNNLTVSNKVTDTRNTISFEVRLYNDDTHVQLLTTQTINSIGKFAVGFTIPSDVQFNKLRFKHNGITRDVSICIMPFDKSGPFAVSFDVTGYDPSVVGGMVLSNIQLEKASSATSYEPYENICPISGRNSVDIDGCGKNLFDGEIESGSIASENGQPMGHAGRVRSKDYIKVNPNTTYKFGSNIKYVFIFEYRTNSSSGYIQRIPSDWYNLEDNKYFEFNTTSNTYYIKFVLAKQTSTAEVIVPSDVKYSILAETNDFLISNDLTISLGQTVYGGTLDVEKGELVVDRASVDLSTLDYSPSSAANNVFRSDSLIGIVKEPNISSIPTTAICSIYYTKTFAALEIQDNGAFAIAPDSHNNHGRFVCVDYRYSTISDYVTGVTGQTLCYELKTPITLTLTPNTINLLKGINNISTDGDKITLTYRDGKFATLDGAVPKMTFRGEDYTMGIDDIGLFLKNLTKSTKTYIADPLLNFDGTVATYKKIMKQWFINNGVNVMDSKGITHLCERWYEITKQGWKGGTSFPEVGVSTGSTGTRFDDNVDMSVTPSTDTSANTDTYQGLPLFAITDCNWELDSDGNILITAIDGITDNFVRDDPTKFVGVMQQTGWVKKVDDETTQKYYYADDKNAYPDLVPLPEAIKLDGTVRSFVCHAKYMSGIVDSKMTCCSGVIPRRNISHDGLVTLPDNIGTQYSGGTSVDWSFLVWMQRIKYASLTSDGVLQGCCNYNYQYYVKVGETDVKRLILASNQGSNLKVGSTITFGAYTGSADRGNGGTYSISGQDGAIITSIEDVTIDGTTYKAVYVNTANTFTTVANGDATNGTTIVSTYHWISGSCDNVKGNDGSPVSATNGIYPAKLQGIEYMVGGYEVFADVIMNISGGYYNPYYARKSTDQATSISSAMVQSTLKCAQPTSDAWRYIQKHGFDGEIFYPILTGTSSSEYTKDAFYENGTGTTTGTREWLAFGALYHGSGSAGLSSLAGSDSLSNGGWNFVARLSCNGNRGILLTA